MIGNVKGGKKNKREKYEKKGRRKWRAGETDGQEEKDEK
jgi:hypothetical protein